MSVCAISGIIGTSFGFRIGEPEFKLILSLALITAITPPTRLASPPALIAAPKPAFAVKLVNALILYSVPALDLVSSSELV